jgi:hypothetical protein
MSVANELSSDIAAALLRGGEPENAEARLRATLAAHSVLQSLSARERPRLRGEAESGETTRTPRGEGGGGAS